MSAFDTVNPLPAADVERAATALRRLLAALDREIVATALIGEGETDLLDPVRQEVDRVCERLHVGVGAVSERLDLRSRGLTVLDAFADERESGADHGVSVGGGCTDAPEGSAS